MTTDDLVRERNELRMLASFYRSVALCGDGDKLKSDAEELAKVREVMRGEVTPKTPAKLCDCPWCGTVQR